MLVAGNVVIVLGLINCSSLGAICSTSKRAGGSAEALKPQVDFLLLLEVAGQVRAGEAHRRSSAARDEGRNKSQSETQ